VIVSSRFQQLDTLLIDTGLARCEIALFGAQVLSFTPRSDGRDLLWCSDARLASGRPVRGGIPVCWPWFARQGVGPEAPQHGFVRTMRWRVATCAERPDGQVRVLLTLDPRADGWPGGAGWPGACTPELEVLVGDALEVSLRTVNASAETVRLTQALHTYFRVGDVRRTDVHGLQGVRYLDKLRGFDEFGQDTPWGFENACDRIYIRCGARHVIDDPILDRSVVVETRRSASTVVWNPGAEGIAALGDVPLSDWYQYLCVEAANCGPLDGVTLAPGDETTLVQRITSAPRGTA
jgi:glucose-6-phosphate 1-epimerase